MISIQSSLLIQQTVLLLLSNLPIPMTFCFVLFLFVYFCFVLKYAVLYETDNLSPENCFTTDLPLTFKFNSALLNYVWIKLNNIYH